jgi:hypothetical protein
LHEFARELFVRDLTSRKRSAIEDVEISAHRWRKSNVVHELAKIAEGIVGEHVVERRYRACVDSVGRDDKYLA